MRHSVAWALGYVLPMGTLTELFATLTELVDSLTAVVTESPWTYVLIFAVAAIDVVFPLLPAEATITAAAVLAGTGQLNIAWVMIAAGLGAFVGDNVAYWIGRSAGRPLVERIMRGDTGRLENVEEQFKIRGGTFIIVGRFVPGGRTAVAVGAGVLGFKWARFILYDAIAAVIWAFQAALPGYIGGLAFADRPWLALVIGFVLSALIAGGIALFLRWRSGRAKDDRGPADEPEASDDDPLAARGKATSDPAADDTPDAVADSTGEAAPTGETTPVTLPTEGD